jgi:hypothetical protein
MKWLNHQYYQNILIISKPEDLMSNFHIKLENLERKNAMIKGDTYTMMDSFCENRFLRSIFHRRQILRCDEKFIWSKNYQLYYSIEDLSKWPHYNIICLQTFWEKKFNMQDIALNNFLQDLLKLCRTGIYKILKFKRNRWWEQ